MISVRLSLSLTHAHSQNRSFEMFHCFFHAIYFHCALKTTLFILGWLFFCCSLKSDTINNNKKRSEWKAVMANAWKSMNILRFQIVDFTSDFSSQNSSFLNYIQPTISAQVRKHGEIMMKTAFQHFQRWRTSFSLRKTCCLLTWLSCCSA